MSATLPILTHRIPHIDPRIFIGMSYGDAKTQIEGYGYVCKVVKSPTKPPWRQMKDYDPLTINVFVIDNRVSSVYRG